MHQPWLNEPEELPLVKGAPDDFSPGSATMPLRRTVMVLAICYLFLLTGRSEQILDATYGLPMWEGTATLIKAAETWRDWLDRLGLPVVLDIFRGLLAAGRDHGTAPP